MDILSHGLWGAAPFYRKGGLSYWGAFLIGMLPDMFAFAPHMALMILGPERHAIGEPLPLSSHNSVTFILYNISHSFIIFLSAFLLIFALRKKIFYELMPWGLHILTDIPTHSTAFFPTPFLWPFSSFRVNGFSWGQPWFIFLNYSFLAVIYIILYFRPRAEREG